MASYATGSTARAMSPTSEQCKSIHRLHFDADQYVAALGLPERELNQSIDWMHAKVQPRFGRPLRVLAIGVGPGRLELPFVEALEKTFGPVDADFIDYGVDSLTALTRRLRRSCYDAISLSDLSCGAGLWQRNGISLRVVLADFESWEPTGPCYDVIVASFVINFFHQWVAGVNKIVDLLQPSGAVFYTEDTGDICFLDNTFEAAHAALPTAGCIAPDRLRFRQYWHRYYSWRDQLGFPWDRQPSPSDMALVNHHFAEIAATRGGEISTTQIGPWLSAALSWEDWLLAVSSHPLFHCLTTIPPGFRTQIAAELRHLISLDFGDKARGTRILSTNVHSLLLDKPSISVGHRIYCLNRASP